MSVPYMTLAEIYAKYPNEWVVNDRPKKGWGGEVRGGYVVAHAADNDETIDAAIAALPRPFKIAVQFTGPLLDPDEDYFMSGYLAFDFEDEGHEPGGVVNEPYMTKDEIYAKYPMEYVLLEQPVRDRYREVVGGHLVVHAPDRGEFYQRLSEYKPSGGAIFFTGPIFLTDDEYSLNLDL